MKHAMSPPSYAEAVDVVQWGNLFDLVDFLGKLLLPVLLLYVCFFCFGRGSRSNLRRRSMYLCGIYIYIYVYVPLSK